MNWLRIWPIVCQFGVGALLFLVGLWCGLSGRYLDLRSPEDRRFIAVCLFGFLLMLGLVSFFTFWAPNWSNPATP
jgi:hypothetical protein